MFYAKAAQITHGLKSSKLYRNMLRLEIIVLSQYNLKHFSSIKGIFVFKADIILDKLPFTVQ